MHQTAGPGVEDTPSSVSTFPLFTRHDEVLGVHIIRRISPCEWTWLLKTRGYLSLTSILPPDGGNTSIGLVIMTLAITGFGSFPSAPVNPTSILIDILREKYPRKDAVYRVLATTYADIEKHVAEIARQPLIIGFGLHAGVSGFRIERTAWNRTEKNLADAMGKFPERSEIKEGAAEKIDTKFPIEHLANQLTRGGFLAELSNDPGSYLCNYYYYRLFSEIGTGNRDAIFIHLPMATEFIDIYRKIEPAQTFSRHMSLSEMVDGALVIIDAIFKMKSGQVTI